MINFLSNCICIIPTIYIIVIIFIRIFSKNDKKINNFVKPKEYTSYTPTKKECFFIFLYALGFRLLIFVLSIIVFYIFINNNNVYNIEDVIQSWEKWDSTHYIRISHGYDYYTENGDYNMLVFFPLYPYLLNILNNIINNPQLSGIIISCIAYSLACIFIYKLVCLDYGKSIAKKTLVIMSLYPFAFFFGGIMTESIFLLFISITLYAIRQHNWPLVGIAGFFASISRITGIFIILSAIIEIIEYYKVFENLKNKKFLLDLFFTKLLPLILIPCGFLFYLSLNHKYTGDWFYFTGMQEKYWHQKYTPFYMIINTITNIMSNYKSIYYDFTVYIPQLITILFMYTVLTIGARKHKTVYLVFYIVYIITNTSTNFPLSIGRYFSCALPSFIFLATFTEKKPKMYIPLISSFAIMFGIYFVAFLNWRNIM